MTTFVWTIGTDDYCIVTCRAAIVVRNAKLTTKCSDVINYKNNKNNYALIIAYNFHKTGCGQTDRLTDIATLQNMTAEWSNNLSYNNTNNIYTLPTA